MCSPIGHDLREDASDLWVRFHLLPGSKRYPDSEAEYTEAFRRHHVLLDDLLEQDSRSTELALIVGAWPDTGYAARGRGLDLGVVPSEYWGSVLTDSDSDGWESWLDLFVAQLTLDSPMLDMILRLVADEKLHEVIVTDSDLSWLYHPYDGGADVIASSPSQRARLTDAHRDWLSSHHLGL